VVDMFIVIVGSACLEVLLKAGKNSPLMRKSYPKREGMVKIIPYSNI